MARRNEFEEDDWDDEESEGYDDDSDSTIPCPYCRRDIHEDAQRCPYCERYISEEDAPPARKPVVDYYRWRFICLYIVYRWMAG